MTSPRCPTCGTGRGYYLGDLGRLRWYRCRDCGVDFNRGKLPKAKRPRRKAPSLPDKRED